MSQPLLPPKPRMFSCDVCKLDGVEQEAKFFCCDCNDYMCGLCETHHQKVKVTRLHKVLSSDAMLQDTKAKQVTTAEGATSPCVESSGTEGATISCVESGEAEQDSTPAEDDFQWETTEAEEYMSQNDIATRAEDLLTSQNKTIAGRLFLNAKLSPHSTMKTISVRHPSDKYEPLVTGMAFLSNGELLVTDYNNKYLKLLNRSLQIRQTLECPGIPYGVSIINDKEAIVTFPLQRNMVQFLSLSPKMILGKCIPMSNGCWGVTVSKNRIFIACNANGHREEVVEMDMNGKRYK